MQTKTYKTNYSVAVNWLDRDFVLCNRIAEVDNSVIENARFEWFDENDNPKEIFQWFLTDCNEDDVAYLEEHFGLLFTYSELLDTYVLCVDHYGTSWDYVYCETDIEQAQAEYGQKRK